MHIPCPWPIEYHARFDWTKVEYQYQPNYVNVLGTFKSQVSFYVDNHVPDCEYILAYMNDRCAIQSYNCVVPASDDVRHVLQIQYTVQVPVHSVPGIEPPQIPFAMGDCFPTL